VPQTSAARPVRLGYVANPFSLPVVIATERSYFALGGLALEIETFPNGSAATLALNAGTIDLGVSGHLQTLQAARGPLKQVFIAPLGFEEAPHHLPVALLARSVTSGRGLEGRSVAVSALGAISELQLRIFMHAEGADYGALTLTPMPFAEMGPALRDGTVAAASVPEPFATALVAAGIGRVIDRGSLSRALGPGQRAMVAGLVAGAAWAASEPAIVGRAAEAVGRAIHDLRVDPDLAGARMVAAANVAGLGGATLQTPRFDRYLAADDLQLVFDLALAHGLIDQPADAAALIFSSG
jgi:ABC-type nitrate/sulfonate/bicarbonate transport system substrate-binding protein